MNFISLASDDRLGVEKGGVSTPQFVPFFSRFLKP